MPQAPEKSKDRAQRRSETVRQALRNPSHRQLSKWQRDQRLRLAITLAGIGLGALVVAVLVGGYVVDVVLRGQETVAEIHAERVTASDLVNAARPYYRSINRQAELLRERGLGSQAGQLRTQLGTLPYQVLSAEVERRLIAREAQARNLSLTEADVQQEIRTRMEREAELQRSAPGASPGEPPAPAPTLTDAEVDTTYREFLRRTGLDDRVFRQQARDQTLRDRLLDALGAEVPASAEQAHVRHILVSEEQKANELLKQLQEGASFEELARAESTDPGSKDRGGDLGWFPRGIMNPQFEEAAFGMAPDAPPLIVRSPNGWHVIDVLEKDAERPLEADDLEAVRVRAFQNWLANARQSPEVRLSMTAQTAEWVTKRLQARFF